MSLRLNGWQRLWILLGLSYLPFIVVVSSLWWPRESVVTERWRTERDHVTALKFSKPQEKRAESFRELDDTQLRELANDERLTEEDYLKLTPSEQARFRGFRLDEWTLDPDTRLRLIDERHESELLALWAKRRQIVTAAFVGWALPLVVVYALGWGVSWVRRGFRPQGPDA